MPGHQQPRNKTWLVTTHSLAETSNDVKQLRISTYQIGSGFKQHIPAIPNPI